MKKIFLVFLIIGLLLFSGIALAQDDTDTKTEEELNGVGSDFVIPENCIGIGVDCFGIPPCDVNTNEEAAAWLFEEACISPTTGAELTTVIKDNKKALYCHSTPKMLRLDTRASVATWSLVYLSVSDIYWKIYKPDTYYTDCITLGVATNGSIDVEFEYFDPLYNYDTLFFWCRPVINVNWYLQEVFPLKTPAPSSGQINWSCNALNNKHYDVDAWGCSGVAAKIWKVWQKIMVPNDAHTCEYKDPWGGLIVVTINNQKCWVDSEIQIL